MIKNTNNYTVDTALITLGDIETARINWETGSYKKSNEELYGVLDRCRNFYQQIKIMEEGKRKLIKAIDGVLIERGMPSQKNTSLVTKVVRCVFGDVGKRAFTYAKSPKHRACTLSSLNAVESSKFAKLQTVSLHRRKSVKS